MRVQALQGAIAAGEFDEDLLLELHRRLCADLIPELAGRWRTSDVVVGDDEPPAYPLVPQRMREYARDSAQAVEALARGLWVEDLALASGHSSCEVVICGRSRIGWHGGAGVFPHFRPDQSQGYAHVAT